MPRDLKFYTFYGECPLVLEIDRNKNKTRYCWWDENGDVMPTGKYEGELFRGDGFDKNLLDIAKATSLRIPAPFIRIDFLNANPQPVLGEFTPRPGIFIGLTCQRTVGSEESLSRHELACSMTLEMESASKNLMHLRHVKIRKRCRINTFIALSPQSLPNRSRV